MHDRELVAQPMIELVDHQAPIVLLLVEPSNEQPIVLGGPDDQAGGEAVEREVADLIAERLRRRREGRIEEQPGRDPAENLGHHPGPPAADDGRQQHRWVVGREDRQVRPEQPEQQPNPERHHHATDRKGHGGG